MYSDWVKGEIEEQAGKEAEVPQDKPATRVVEGAFGLKRLLPPLFLSLGAKGRVWALEPNRLQKKRNL